MTPDEKVGRLETLLARVQRRAAEPRRAPTSQAASPVASQVSPKATTGAMAAAPMPAPVAAPVAPVAPVAPAAAANGGAANARASEPPASKHPTSPPLSFPSEPPEAAGPATVPPVTTVDSDDSEVDVEVSTEVVDIDVDVDVDDMGMPLESGAQPVADHAADADQASFGDTAAEDAILETTMADAQLPVLGAEHEVHSEAQPDAKPLANEIEEPAPSSSPRPIASEKPETFEDESAPRHTPPPESGKQVAAAPSTPPSRKTSVPPPSLEGHTLIGGWREPGLGGPIVGAPGGPGVRVPAPAAAAPPPAQAKAEIPPEPVTGTRPSAPPRHSDRPLSPEITRADLGAASKVASFEGTAPAFKPSTFGDLLDASLGL